MAPKTSSSGVKNRPEGLEELSKRETPIDRREMLKLMALGAGAREILRMVLGRGMGMVLVGFLAGGVLAAFAARALAGVLFVSPLDPVSFGVTLLVLFATAALANFIPANRAARVDPAVALRGE